MLGRDLRGQPTDRPTKQLGDTVALWMITVRRLAESGPIAWAAMDARFPPDEDESPKGAPESPLGPPERVASLDLITTFVVGDLVLDHLAYAELVRRGAVPTWRRGVQKVPAMWPALMDTLEESGGAMLGPARSLDVSLAVARDVLVAHRDPDAFELPGYSSWGAIRLERPVLDEDRRRMAEALVRTVNRGLDHPWPDSYDYQHLVDTIGAVPPQLTPDVRKGLRRAFRAAGFESPALTTVIRDALRILRLYDEGITGPAPS